MFGLLLSLWQRALCSRDLRVRRAFALCALPYLVLSLAGHPPHLHAGTAPDSVRLHAQTPSDAPDFGATLSADSHLETPETCLMCAWAAHAVVRPAIWQWKLAAPVTYVPRAAIPTFGRSFALPARQNRGPPARV